jgi:hypothetical protein
LFELFILSVHYRTNTNTNTTPTQMSFPLRPHHVPLSDFQATIPYQHESLLLEAKSTLGQRPSSPDNLKRWEPTRTSLLHNNTATKNSPTSLTIRPPTRSDLQSLSPTTILNSSNSQNDTRSISSTPRSIASKSIYFSAQAHRYGKRPSTTSNSTTNNNKRKAASVLQQNKSLGYKFQLLDPIQSLDDNNDDNISMHSRPQTTGNINRKRRRRPSRDRAATKSEMVELLNQVKTLRGIHVEGKKGETEQDKLARKLAARAQRENVPTRQVGDMRGLSGRVRVDFKLDRFRDPNQLAVLMNALGMKIPIKGKKKKKKKNLLDILDRVEEDKEKEKEKEDDSIKHITLAQSAILRTPRTSFKMRQNWGDTLRRRQHLVKVKRAQLIEAELQRVYDVGSSFKVARKKQAADDRLSERKVARGWNRMLWRFIAAQHFEQALGRGREHRATKNREQLAQIKIASNYRRRQSVKILHKRRRADYVLKLHLKRIVRQWKARRLKSDADVLIGWLKITNNFSKRVLGYLLLKKSATLIQTCWKDYRAMKKVLVQQLSVKMFDIAKAGKWEKEEMG